MKRFFLFLLLVNIIITNLYCLQVKLKDIVKLSGLRTNELIGYGIVIGLNGTGDKGKDYLTVSSIVNLLEKLNIRVPHEKLETANCAAVIVTASLPPTFEEGENIDVTVSSIGNAKSLEGGTLLKTPLLAGDGEIYAYAQGSLIVGGHNVEINNNKVRKNIATTGFIPNGGVIEKSLNESYIENDEIVIYIDENDFVLSNNIIKSINEKFNEKIAKTFDGKKIVINIPSNYKDEKYYFLAELFNIEVEDTREPAIVLDEKTGTVILGGDITVDSVAIAHGNIHISVSSTNVISQPNPLSLGMTLQAIDSKVTVIQDNAKFSKINKNATLDEIVKGLNSMGVSSSDIISIIMNLKVAGAIKGKIIVR